MRTKQLEIDLFS